jgi:lipopolysaccharide export system protein LptA
MKRSEAAKYARWSALAALLLASVTAAVYFERKWVAHREKANAPPPAPKDVTRLSSGLTFSQGDGNRTIYTVEASKATDFKDNGASLLEDVKITIFGKTGERHDIIHTRSCQYDKANGDIVCSGEVTLDLASAADAERAAKNPGAAPPQKVHAQTQGVTFNRATGISHTDQFVKFAFPNGTGEAVGMEYHSEQGALRLLRDVRLSLAPPRIGTPGEKKTKSDPQESVRVKGSSLDFERDSKTMHLHGPVEADSRTARLLAGELTLTLDQAFRAEKLLATRGSNGKKPELDSNGTDEQTNISGETLTAHFAPQGWLTRVEGEGSVEGSRQSGKEQDDFRAENGTLELQPKVNQAKDLSLKGNVLLKTRAENAGETRTLQTGALHVEFAEGKSGEGGKPKRAETIGKGSIEWTDAAPQSATPGAPANAAAGRTKLQADRLEMEFGAEGKAQKLVTTGNVQTEREVAGKPLQTATAQNGIAQLLATGGSSQMDLQGDVRLKEGDRNGQADHALFVRATQTALLTGKAFVRDATTETKAPRITFVQNTGDIRAEGGVRSTDFAARGNGLQLAAVPANLSSDTMQANSKTGRALYSGHARLWQGDSVMEADSIELLREAKVLNATGKVRAVFPEAAGQSPPQTAAMPAAPKKPKLWHVSAGMLTYRDAENRAHLEKDVVAQSTDLKMQGPAVDLYFTRSEKPNSNGTGGSQPASTAGGSQQISRAVGTGGVTVQQGTRKAIADRGEYIAADGKFVMSGGNPTIFDAAEGTTTGRQLTFFLADDTIIVDSENGSRTLTKHRVEK